MKASEVASAGMAAQAARLRVVSENVANADTPGFRRKLIGFEQAMSGDTGRPVVEARLLGLDQTPLERVHAPHHPLADEDGYYDGSNVNLMVEIADAREAQRSYEANLKIYDQARGMASSLLDLLRR